MTPKITRIAPSPTGLFHIGSARTALFNWLVARSTGGKFILRIDDTDIARNTVEAVQVIDDAMSWLDLDFDIRVRQSDRLVVYRNIAHQLVSTGKARYDGDAIRLNNTVSFTSWYDSLVGDIQVTSHDIGLIDGLVLLRSDSMPTYHLASVIDDMEMGVNWIIRGTDHMANTPKQIALWHAIASLHGNDIPLPSFTHLGLITQKGKKVSKRDGSASLLDYRDHGISSEAMCNWLLRLGWGPKIDDKTTKMINRERALDLFLTGGNMRPSPANMDVALLNSLDRKYKGAFIRNMKND